MKRLIIFIIVAVAAAVGCHVYFSYSPIERQVATYLGVEKIPLEKTEGDWVKLFGKPSYFGFKSAREIAGRPVESQFVSLYDLMAWWEKGVIAFARRNPDEIDSKFRDNSGFRITNIIVPARWEFDIVKPDGSVEKMKTDTLIPIRVGGKPFFRLTPSDFKKMYPFMREVKPGLYTMGKYPFAAGYTAYFSNGELQFFQINREFGILEGL